MLFFAAMVAEMELFWGGGYLIRFVGLYVLLVLLWIIWIVVGLGRSKENRGDAAEFLLDY